MDSNECKNDVCNSDQFQCKSSKKCIHKEWVCDNVYDCPDGSDEYNCGWLIYKIYYFERIKLL